MPSFEHVSNIPLNSGPYLLVFSLDQCVYPKASLDIPIPVLAEIINNFNYAPPKQ